MKPSNLKTLIVNFSFLSGGEILCKIATFVAFVYLARILGPGQFGTLEFTIALTLVFSLIVDFGTGPYGAREIAKNPGHTGDLLHNIVVVRLALAIICYLLLTTITLFVFQQATLRSLVQIYGLSLFAIPFFLQWMFQGLETMRWIALGSVVRQLSFATGVFVLVHGTSDLLKVAYIECLGVALVLLIHWSVYKRLFQMQPGQVRLTTVRTLVSQAFPIGLSELTWALTWYFATILLGLIAEDRLVGWFASAHRPVLALHTFVWLYFFNLLPAMSRKVGKPIEEFQNMIAASIRLTSWLAVLIGLAGVILAEPIILTVFGSEFVESVEIFRILILMIPVTLLSGHFRYSLIAFNLQRYEFLSAFYSALSCIGLVYSLTQWYGAVGAAWGLLAAQLINFAFAMLFTHKMITRLPLFGNLIKPVVAGLLLVVVYESLPEINPWLMFSLSSLAFVGLIPLFEPEIRRMLIKRSV